jgi:hypothetical protein
LLFSPSFQGEIAGHQARARPLSMAASIPKPKLYIYDHCVSRTCARRIMLDDSPPHPVEYGHSRTYRFCLQPFCVRARIIFGLKRIPHQLIFLDNDDVDTPTSLVGRKVRLPSTLTTAQKETAGLSGQASEKSFRSSDLTPQRPVVHPSSKSNEPLSHQQVVPILEIVGADGRTEVLPESMDIVRRVDQDAKFGPPMLQVRRIGRRGEMNGACESYFHASLRVEVLCPLPLMIHIPSRSHGPRSKAVGPSPVPLSRPN